MGGGERITKIPKSEKEGDEKKCRGILCMFMNVCCHA
jgi:hypothetical protein